MAAQTEAYFTCPHCWQENSILLDVTQAGEPFIQDCEVCCNPLQFEAVFSGAELVDLIVTPAQ